MITNEKAFSLLEVLISSCIAVVALLGASSLYLAQKRRMVHVDDRVLRVTLAQREINLIDSILENERLPPDTCHYRIFGKDLRLLSESIEKNPSGGDCPQKDLGKSQIQVVWDFRTPKDLEATFDHPDTLKLPKDLSNLIEIKLSIYQPQKISTSNSLLILREQPDLDQP
jgi:hypothetical protein